MKHVFPLSKLCLVAALFAALPFLSQAATLFPLKRSVLGMELGMTEGLFLQQNRRAVLVKEGPGGERRIYRLEALSDVNLQSVFTRFYGKRLYQVDLQFSRAYVHKIGWFDLLGQYTQRYGFPEVRHEDSPPETMDAASWMDGGTELVLHHIWRVTAGDYSLDSRYVASYKDISREEIPREGPDVPWSSLLDFN